MRFSNTRDTERSAMQNIHIRVKFKNLDNIKPKQIQKYQLIDRVDVELLC